MTGEDPYASLSFHSSSAGVGEITAYLKKQIDPTRPCRLLDIGCGDGGLIFNLLEELPQITATGLDISAENIARARERLMQRTGNASLRARFEVGDYLTGSYSGYDVIISNSVLHLLPCTDAELAKSLARGLNPGGISVHALPYHCGSNSIRVWFRRLLSLIPSKLVEAAAAPVAQALYPDWSEQSLNERIAYLQMVPHRLYGAKFSDSIRGQGLAVIDELDMEQSSFMKLRHRIVVLRSSATHTHLERAG